MTKFNLLRELESLKKEFIKFLNGEEIFKLLQEPLGTPQQFMIYDHSLNLNIKGLFNTVIRSLVNNLQLYKMDITNIAKLLDILFQSETWDQNIDALSICCHEIYGDIILMVTCQRSMEKIWKEFHQKSKDFLNLEGITDGAGYTVYNHHNSHKGFPDIFRNDLAREKYLKIIKEVCPPHLEHIDLYINGLLVLEYTNTEKIAKESGVVNKISTKKSFRERYLENLNVSAKQETLKAFAGEFRDFLKDKNTIVALEDTAQNGKEPGPFFTCTENDYSSFLGLELEKVANDVLKEEEIQNLGYTGTTVASFTMRTSVMYVYFRFE